MTLPDLPTIGQGIAIVLGALVGWFVLKATLRVTARLFTVGCLALVVLVVVGGLAGWLS
jgi:hypothetical protein